MWSNTVILCSTQLFWVLHKQIIMPKNAILGKLSFFCTTLRTAQSRKVIDYSRRWNQSEHRQLRNHNMYLQKSLGRKAEMQLNFLKLFCLPCSSTCHHSSFHQRRTKKLLFGILISHLCQTQILWILNKLFSTLIAFGDAWASSLLTFLAEVLDDDINNADTPARENYGLIHKFFH